MFAKKRFFWFAVISLISFTFVIKVKSASASSLTITTYPNQIIIGNEYTLNVSGTLTVGATYSVKVRAGKATNSLTKAETFNDSNNEWWDDYTSWNSLSLFQITGDNQGNINSPLKFRIKSNTTDIGTYYLLVSAKNNLDSSDSIITATVTSDVQLPIQTSTPTPSATPTPTSTPTVTPTPTTTPTPIPDYNNIKITEVYPNPKDGENEWVELYNDNDFAVNLKGWYLQDSSQTYKSISDFTIAGKAYAYFAFSSGYLNNDGDIVKLLNGNKELKFSIPSNYPSLEKGLSWSFTGATWCVTDPTKGDPNNRCRGITPSSTLTVSPSPTVSPTGLKTSSTDQPDPQSIDSDSMVVKNSSESGLPLMQTTAVESLPASVAGVSTSRKISSQIHNLLLPVGLAGLGLVMIGGASAPFLLPKIKDILNRQQSPVNQ